ncbi:hypothetical protein [Candidatus Avelusimicrobium fimicolum]|uniref:hypothetical protein n=1 Tax=Candidatus Avelusimicrobium fimicolum TaxID=3416216 RepID=UPI003D0A55AD
MQAIISYLKKPYAEKGFIIGTFDSLLKLLALCVWGYLAVILGSLLWESLLTDYNPLNKLWWFSYCFFIFFGATWLAYIVLFVRNYNEEDAD